MGKLIAEFKVLIQRGLFHILVGNFLAKAVTFFGSIFIVRIISKREFGVLGYIENIYSYFFILAGMGLSNSILRYVVLGKSIQEKYTYYSYAYKKSIIWNLFLIIISDIICYFYPHPEPYQDYAWFIWVMVSMIPFQYMIEIVLCNERAMFANQRYAVLSFLFSVSIVLSKIIFGYAMGISGIVYSQLFAYSILSIIYMFIEKKKYYSACRCENLTLQKKREITLYSFQYMITNGLWAFFMLNDTFMLGKFCTPEIVAEYKAAYMVPGGITLISTAIGIFIAPYFVKYQSDNVWIKKNYIKTFLATSILVGMLCFCLGVAAKPVILLLYGNKYLEIAKTMRILLIAAFFNCGFRFTTANILSAMGQVKYNLWISSLGMVFQIVCNLYMIPVYGTEGVALANCLSYGIMAISLFIVFAKKYF